MLTEALALWRGDAYADARSEEWARPEIARLEQLRLDAVEGLAEALLGLGRHTDVVARLEPFVHDHPLRERAWELLALAHYRSGRQAAALACLRRVREVLAGELGIDPGPRLRELETAVLRQDGALTARTAAARPAAPPPGRSDSGRRDPGQRDPGRRADDGPFVGRESALEFLAGAVTAASTARQVVLVDGEPGVGKTRLLRRFRATAGVPVGWGSSPDHETAPALWPWEQVLRDLADAAPGAVLPEEVRTFLSGGAAAIPAYDAQGRGCGSSRRSGRSWPISARWPSCWRTSTRPTTRRCACWSTSRPPRGRACWWWPASGGTRRRR
ncbi:hypothetical protein GCM10027612_19500 [Microbispora bryophytorum subsp. camponoti]